MTNIEQLYIECNQQRIFIHKYTNIQVCVYMTTNYFP